ncbi:amino acid adenylation domain-containing protein [Kitasatospora sp. NPDC028055]|uniref:non-ribosomal peptide synthetase n=1 Tax=Kitasatospora sp. NPDC028055 TaxID=3155653 RepID=UPI0033FD4168
MTAPHDRTVPTPPTSPAVPTSPTFPLTDLQAAYLVGASPLMELGGFRPNLYYELDVVGLDTDRAERAVRQLIDRHEHLRTVVLPEGEQRVLDPGEAAPFRLTVVDLSAAGAEERRAGLAAVRERMRDTGPDPTGWPLFEITAVRLRPHRVRLHLAMSLLLLDSGSTRLLQDEWWRLYLDPDAELPPVTGTFRDCVLAAAARVGTPEHRAHQEYWEARLDTLPEAPRLPMERRPAAISPVLLTRRSFTIDRARWQRLRANFRAHRILPTTALLHIYAEVLGAWASSPRFCLNVLHQNWTNLHPEAAGVVGQFSATLPVEADLTEGDFWARAVRLQKQLWRDLEHADVSGVHVTRELAARRGWTSSAALPYVFNSMLAPVGHGAAAPRPACRTVHTGLRTPQVLIDNQTKDAADGGIECVWDVVDEAFPPGLPQTLFDTYRRLVEDLAAPDGAERLPELLPPGHRETVEALNRPAPAPTGRLEDPFLAQAARRPAAPAVIAPGRTLDYGELEALSGAVAARLADLAVGPGQVVPVVMSKGWEQVVAVLGTLRAGAAYCPVDAALPAERIAALLDACGCPVVLTQSHRSPELPATVAPIQVDAVDPRPGWAPAAPGSAEDLAYVIYTSGSTGVPKGVAVEHRAALNTVLDIDERIELGPEDRVFGISSLSFDLSVWDVFGTLAAGAALVLPAATSRPDPAGWAGCAAEHGVTVWNSVPALAEMLVEVVEQPDTPAAPPVRAFLLSGDWIPVTLPARMRRCRPDVRILAMGGATEAAIWSNLYEVGEPDPAWRSVPYGTPLRGQTMRVLDHRLELRPPHATGRIHIGGTGLARGYAGDQERTAERFHHHPVTGERLYWTGDLGRYWPDGTIEFLGREDRQLKIQGFRVEPGEVETALRTHPAVAECAVCAVPAPGGQLALAALVVAAEGAACDPAELAGFLRARLPSYLVPGRIRPVDRLPLTGNGKVDARAALALLDAPGPEQEGGELDDGLLKRLAELWTELLQVPALGPDSDFFALGGNSLLALRLVNRIRAEFGVELRFGEVFEAPTLRALGARLAEGGRTASCAVRLADRPGPELVLFHPVGGSVSSYLPLAQAWPGPVLAFQHPALGSGSGESDAPEPPDLASLAARYREELERLRPDGPYLLGGWSMGGVLAHEVARQLAEHGRESWLFMIDSTVRDHRVPSDETARQLEFLSDLAGGELPEAAAEAVRAAAPGTEAAAARDAAVAHGLLPAEADLPTHRRLSRVHARNLALLAAHHPGVVERPALLVVAEHAHPGADPAADWRQLCPDLAVLTRPQNHYTIVSAQELSLLVGELTTWLKNTPPGATPRDEREHN